MNLPILNNFINPHPDFDDKIDCLGIAVCCSFNHYGTLLAVGCNDGRVIIWDFLTRGRAKIVSVHIMCITRISWNYSGHLLLSTSADNTIKIWEVLEDESILTLSLPSPILNVKFHPKYDSIFIVNLYYHQSLIFNTHLKFYCILPICVSSLDVNVISSFDRSGKYIYFANGHGVVTVRRFYIKDLCVDSKNICSDGQVFDNITDTNYKLVDCDKFLKVTSAFRIHPGVTLVAIKAINFAKNDKLFLLNCSDRVIRMYSPEILPPYENDQVNYLNCIKKFQDLVNKTVWVSCIFSGDNEFVVAGASKQQHCLYIWQTVNGNLVKILNGAKGETVIDLDYHPSRPMLASVSNLGTVSLWLQAHVENWSAFAPDFNEVETNVEYDERESEFDIEDEDKSTVEEMEVEVDDDNVDVTTVEPLENNIGDEDDSFTQELLYLMENCTTKKYVFTEPLLFLPVTPYVDPNLNINKDVKIETENEKESVQLPERKKIKIELNSAPTTVIHPMALHLQKIKKKEKRK
ncbi:COMPASS component SWD1 [Intoshia linei]|uniref:COMPASS component SWD1 n=1 Tax=Intoshia linei TaxID=1819745 RepID=A0A177B9B8_9BILA|nr:COMPASS component SWD1 [Intoshia linei]